MFTVHVHFLYWNQTVNKIRVSLWWLLGFVAFILFFLAGWINPESFYLLYNVTSQMASHLASGFVCIFFYISTDITSLLYEKSNLKRKLAYSHCLHSMHIFIFCRKVSCFALICLVLSRVVHLPDKINCMEFHYATQFLQFKRLNQSIYNIKIR